MRPTSAPQRSLVACRPRPGPASGRSREPGPPRPRAASRCEDPALRPQEACSGVRPLQTHGHIASATSARKSFGFPTFPGARGCIPLGDAGPRGSLCRAEGAGWPGLGPLPRGWLSPCLNQTPRERREQVPPGETKLLVPTPETPAPAAPAGQPASSSEPLRSGPAPPPSSSGPSTRGTEVPVPGPATQRPPASAPGSVWCRLPPVPRLPCTPFYLNFPRGVRVTPERPLAALPRRPRPPRRVWCWDLPSRKTKAWRKVEKQGSHIEALQRN